MTKLIYKPKGKAGEYASLACNIYTGCDHQCVYCYVRNTPVGGFGKLPQPAPRRDFLKKLAKEAKKRKDKGQVLLSFISDPYQSFDVERKTTRETIKILKNAGFSVCTLTKGGKRALGDIDLFDENDAFATTLTWLDDKQSLLWEPGAALSGERIETLERFHSDGIPTWVSLEPVLCQITAIEIIRQTHEFVDHYKVGRINYINSLPDELRAQVVDIGWEGFTLEVVDLLKSLGKSYYIKESLAKLVPGIDAGELPEQKSKVLDVGYSQPAMF